MTTLSLEDRIDRLESIAAIQQAKARYCTFCDNGYDPKGIGSLFTEDAVWDGGSLGVYRGRPAIEEFFRGISGMFVFAGHLVTNPNVEFVDKDTATVTWRLLEPATIRENGKDDSRLLLAGYVDNCVRRDGKWLVKHLTLKVNFFVNIGDGWAKTAIG